MSQFSDKLVSSCFPDADSVFDNLAEGMRLADSRGEQDKFSLLAECDKCLRQQDFPSSIRLAKRAGYSLMASAIERIFKQTT